MINQDTLDVICTKWPEILVFYAIRELGGFIFHMNHEMADGRIPERDHPLIDTDVQKAIEENRQIVQSLTRFGIASPTDVNGSPSPEYWSWYHWWNNYENSLTVEQFRQLEKDLESESDLSAWRPQGDWKTA